MKTPVIFDVETYRNYFLIQMMNWVTKKVITFEQYPGQDLDTERLRSVMTNKKYTFISFNGIKYDLPMVSMAATGTSNGQLKRCSDEIIQMGLWPWQFTKQFGVHMLDCDHIDLIEVAPGRASLKIYGGRIHSKKIQDLPIEPDAHISEADRAVLRTYCVNDLYTTGDLLESVRGRVELREQMSERYNLDLRSKSDAQVAEAVIKDGVEKETGKRLKKPGLKPGEVFQYWTPNFISFQTPHMQEVLRTVQGAWFEVSRTGKIPMPKEIEELKVQIGESSYTMGIGGLHSNEKKTTHYADDGYLLIDRDVTSYYPFVILNLGLAPKSMGAGFTRVYKDIVETRLKAKASGDTLTANSLKITINGSFGKFGSHYSYLFSPPLLIQTTVTGQLALLMLIEALEMEGIQVVSGNTDGIVIKPHESQVDLLNNIVWWWESVTGFDTEETQYRSLHSRDVNSYIAVKPDLSVKLKGAYSMGDLERNVANEVCIDAVINYLTREVDLDDSIYFERDIRRFINIRQVNGGGVWSDPVTGEDHYLGKAVRWYYSTNGNSIHYKTNGNKVGTSDGAVPLMDITDDSIPADLDYDRYIDIAESMLRDLGC